ncbi:MAG: rhodanese-like domain-containing protein [Clostridiaceae bacterium]|nr:rhodanese-like domain-containing protein [Clostridiaceae bacterium]
MCLLSACTTNHQSNSDKAGANPTDSSRTINYTNIMPNEAQKRLDNEKEIILLDVRTQEEYEEKHIPNSQLIPVEVIEKEALTKLTDKNASIFVYCRSGRRSVTAAEALVKMGYTKVYNLGGINDWPYEVASGK